MSLRNRLPRLGDGRDTRPADVPDSGSFGVPDELTPHTERKGEMSSLESSGFSSPPPEGLEPAAVEPLAPLAPLQPFDELQPASPEPAAHEPAPAPEPFQPLNGGTAEQFQPLEPLQVQELQPLQPLQPTMPPLPLLTGAEPAAAPEVVAPPAQSPQEIANLGVPLGTLIFRAGLLTEEQLEDALQEGVRTGKRLGEVLVESGQLGEGDLGRLLADQKGLRFVELSSVSFDPAATGLLTAEKAHMFAALPIGFDGGVPLVAVADPSNELVTENLRRALGQEPRLVVASRSDLHSAIDRLHGSTVADEPEARQEVTTVEEPAPALEPVSPEPVAVAPLTVEPVVVEPVVVEPPEPPEPLEPLAPVQPAEVAEPTPAPELYAVQPEPPAAYEPPPAPEPVAVEPVAPVVEEQPAVPPLVAEVVEPALEPTYTAIAEPTPAPAAAADHAPEPAAVAEPEVAERQPVVAEPVLLEPVVAEVVSEPEPTFSRIEEQQAAPEPDAQAAQELPSALSYDVSLRLTDGERVPIGSFGEPEKAREYARDVVKHLSDEDDGWPFFSGRFLRPDTIVSVDIVPVGEPDRWLGSSVRSNWASRLNR